MPRVTLTKPHTDTQAEASRLISAGYRVWPVKNKRPVRAGFARAAGPDACAAVHEFAGADVAVLAGPCAVAPDGHHLVLVDLDGPVPAAGVLPEGWPATLTAKAGAHRWYFAPAKAWRQTARVRSGDGWAVDTRGWGGYGQETRDGVVLWDNPGAAPATLTAEQCAELFRPRAGVNAQAVALAKVAPASVQGENGSAALWNVALDLVRGLRLPPGEALAVLRTHYNPRCQPPWSEAELTHKVTDALEKGQVAFGYLAVQQPPGGYLTTEKGAVKACFENYVRYVRAAYPDLRWDEVALVAYDGPKRVDVETLSGHVRTGAATAVGLDPAKGAACDAIIHVAREKTFNRTRDALAALPRWDGRRRLDRWLAETLGAADTEYVRAVGRAWLVSAMARAFEPGCKADHMLLLEGAQGIGKSTALAVLAGAGYKDLTFNAHDKDAMQDLRGAWIVEYSELAGLGKREDEWLKGHIARATDSYRASYGRDSLDYPRACVLAGTVNPQGDGRYLRDSENRRYWPVACAGTPATLRARLGWLVANRDQVLAEALAAYRSGEVWYLDRDVGQTAEQEARREVDPLEVSVPEAVGDELEVNMRMLRCDPRLVRDLPPTAVGQGRAIARVLKRMGFEELPGGRAIWRRKRV
jgi:hypothetical protein